MRDPEHGRRSPQAIRCWPAVVGILAAILTLLIPARRARAEGAPECPQGNLLAGAMVSGDVDRARLPALFDGIVVREGMPWPGPDQLVIFRGPVVFDLGRALPLSHLRLQSDSDQGVSLEMSADGKEWSRVSVPPSADTSGMVRRSAALPGAPARWVRVSAPDPSGVLALTELEVHCARPPKEAQPAVATDDRPPPWKPGPLSSVWEALTGDPLVSPEQADVIRLLLALATAGGAAAFVLLGRRRSRARDLGLAGLSLLAALSYFNFGAYHYPAFAHQHDEFHYFIGSRYFPELGYTDLYDCTLVAQAEAGFPQRVSMFTLRDLRTNQFVPAADALARAPRCHERFTPERWQRFTEDVRWFTNGAMVEDRLKLVRDHGFNATPLWISLGRGVSGSLPAGDGSVGRGASMFGGFLPALDPLLLLAAAAVMGWAFGWRAALLAVIVFACDPLANFSWVGGGYLRQAWLFASIAGMALLRRRRWIGAGAALAVAAHLQVFPALALGGIALVAAWQRRARRRLAPSVIRVLGAAAVTAAALALAVVPLTGRSDCWPRFVENAAKHAATPGRNLVGLPAVLSYSWEARAEVTSKKEALDVFAEPRRLRVERLARLRPLHLLLALAALAGLAAALRRPRPLWWAAALGVTPVLVLVSVSCYYLSWLVLLVPMAMVGRRMLAVLLGGLVGLCLLTLAISESELLYVASGAWLIAFAAAFVFVTAPRRRPPAAAP